MLFTPREQDILHLVADLHSRTEIQAILGCSVSTVSKYINRLYIKTEVHLFVHLAKYALEHGYGCRFRAIAQETCQVETRISERKMKKAKPVIIHARMKSKKLVIERRFRVEQ